jgi:hypothetical protein
MKKPETIMELKLEKVEKNDWLLFQFRYVKT